MKLSKFIAELQKIQNEEGDIEIVYEAIDNFKSIDEPILDIKPYFRTPGQNGVFITSNLTLE